MTSLRSFLCVSLIAATAVAEPSARDEYARGEQLFAAGRYGEAAKAFTSAYARKPRAMILFNMGQAYRKDGQFPQALDSYQRFLTAATDSERGLVGEEAARYVRELQANLALQRSLTERDAAEADRVTREKNLHDVPSPPSVPPPSLPPPSVPSPPPALVTAPLAPVATAPPPSTPVYKKWWLWTPVVVVAAGLAVGIGVGVTQHYPSTDLGIRTPTF